MRLHTITWCCALKFLKRIATQVATHSWSYAQNLLKQLGACSWCYAPNSWRKTLCRQETPNNVARNMKKWCWDARLDSASSLCEDLCRRLCVWGLRDRLCVETAVQDPFGRLSVQDIYKASPQKLSVKNLKVRSLFKRSRGSLSKISAALVTRSLYKIFTRGLWQDLCTSSLKRISRQDLCWRPLGKISVQDVYRRSLGKISWWDLCRSSL